MARIIYLLVLLFLDVHGNNVQLDCSGVKHGIEIDLCPHAYYSCQCETTQSALLTWEVLEEQVYSASALSQAGHFMFQDYEVELSIVHSELETVNNFTSVLWLYSENYPQSNVPVTCSNGIESETYYYKRPGLPASPVLTRVNISEYDRRGYSIFISWERGRGDKVVDEYGIQMNTTNQYITTNTTTVVLEGEYNIPLEIRVWAINCAGPSTQVTEEVIVAGCGPPSPPVNGSVSEWTSSQVGAQVTYYCDTDLVLVGERVAHCSLPSLQWIPSSDEVVCTLMNPGTTLISSTITGISFSLPPVSGSRPTIAVVDDSSGVVIVAVVVPLLFIIGIVTIVGIVVIVVYYCCRVKKSNSSEGRQENWYNGQEMLMRPGSNTGTMSLSTTQSPPPSQSPLPPSPYVPPTMPAPVYSMANRPEESSAYSETLGASENGTSSTPMYSETSTSMDSCSSTKTSQD